MDPTQTIAAKLIRYPSTNQFRNLVQTVRHEATYLGKDENDQPIYARDVSLPTLEFRGTVKLHGTNASVVFTPGQVYFQSRERVLGPGDADNMGFYAHMSTQYVALEALKRQIVALLGLAPDSTIALYGEWCGGSIQKNVALNRLPKMFVFFLVNVDDLWFEVDGLASRPDAGIYSILDFPTWHRSIDFNAPELAQNDLAALTNQVEQECPVAAQFGVSGIGEGVVWRCLTRQQPEYWFKVKGKKHSASEVKTLASVDTEAVKDAMDFVARVLTEERLIQGHQHLKHELQLPMDQTSTGEFIRWVVGDVNKEEGDTMAASGLDPKDINKRLSAAAKAWYFQRLDGFA